MYLPENISIDYRFAFEQQRLQNSRPYFPHSCNFTFKLDPTIFAEESYVESEAIFSEKIPWKIFVKVGGKDLYPFMNVGIVDHNNVEEISYRIIFEGITPDYDEKRQETVKIDDQKNEKLFCNEKIWFRSLFDTSEDDQMPLIFKVSIKYRFKGEEFNPFQQSFAPQQPLHEQQPPQYLQHQQWDFESDVNLLDTSILSTLTYLGIVYLILANVLEINFISLLFQIFYYLLSFAFTLVFFFFDNFSWILFYPLTQFLHFCDSFGFFSNSYNVSNSNDTVFSPFYSSDLKFVGKLF